MRQLYGREEPRKQYLIALTLYDQMKGISMKK